MRDVGSNGNGHLLQKLILGLCCVFGLGYLTLQVWTTTEFVKFAAATGERLARIEERMGIKQRDEP